MKYFVVKTKIENPGNPKTTQLSSLSPRRALNRGKHYLNILISTSDAHDDDVAAAVFLPMYYIAYL